MDPLKEVIKQDASTQTDPVTIIENEKTIDISYGELPLKRNRTIDKELRKKSKIVSGSEEFEKEIKKEEEEEEEEEEQQQQQQQQNTKPKSRFYDKCKAYLDSFDHNKENYYEIMHQLTVEVLNGRLTLDIMTSSIMATNLSFFNTWKKQKECLKAIVSSMYIVYTDMSEILVEKGFDDFKELLDESMKCQIGDERSEEIIDFLECYGE